MGEGLACICSGPIYTSIGETGEGKGLAVWLIGTVRSAAICHFSKCVMDGLQLQTL